MENYLKSAKKQFEYYKQLGEKTFEQLDDSALFWTYNDESNSIAIIVKHLAGNMLSRWTDFLNTDGEKTWRNRDTEFESDIETRQQMLTLWNKGWDCLFNALNEIKAGDWNKTIYIRNEPHSIIDAINRQLAHYPYHVGQIIYIGKMAAASQWKALTIPKDQSENYNKEKFSNLNK